jgi:hypothetical protein
MMVNNNDKARQRESLDRVIRPQAEVLIRRTESAVRVGVRFNGSVLEITRIVAQAFGFTMEGSGIRRTGEVSELQLIVALATCCTHLYNVRLI